MTAKSNGIIYLQKDGFQFYSPLLPQLVEFHFVPEIVRDLDISNADLFAELVTLFIDNNHLPISTLCIIVADNACFIKDFLTQQPPVQNPPQAQPDQGLSQEQRDAIDTFIDHVPFDSVASIQFPLLTGVKVLATNKELYSLIKHIFEKKGFTIESILPGLPFGNNLSAKPTIDIPTAALFLEQAHLIKQYNLASKTPVSFVIPEPEEKPQESEPSENDSEPTTTTPSQSGEPKNNKRLYLLIGVFAFLVIVLIFTFISTQSNAPVTTLAPTSGPAAASASTPQNQQPPASTTTSSETDLIPPNPAEFQNLSLQIINASDSAQPAVALQDALSVYPFQSISLENQTLGVSKGIIVFSPLPSIAARSVIIAEVKKITGSVSVQQRADASVDVGIIIGK